MQDGQFTLFGPFDLLEVASFAAFKEKIKALINDFPSAVFAVDMHPDFPQQQIMADLGIATLKVQHHLAHIYAVMAEHNLCHNVLGVAFDGMGYGFDGGIWGGEMLYGEQRVGHLLEIKQPGFDMAARENWRMGASILDALRQNNQIAVYFNHYKQANAVAEMLRKDINSPQTSSMGRLFDAASSLIGVASPVELEQLVNTPEVLPAGYAIDAQNRLSFLPLFMYLLSVRDKTHFANLFHGTIIAGVAEWILRAEKKEVVLAGGCFLNKVLQNGLVEILQKKGVCVYVAQKYSPSDASIAIGQAYYMQLRGV